MAAKEKDGLERIHPSQLRVGVYVCLGEHWMRHPFLFNDFIIENDKQLRSIQELGLKSVLWKPTKSKEVPLTKQAGEIAAAQLALQSETEEEKAAREAQEAEKQARMRLVAERRTARAEAERRYEAASKKSKAALINLFAAPAQAVEALSAITGELASQFGPGSTLYLLALGKTGEGAHAHAMGVMVLSTMVARTLGLDERTSAAIGMGGLLHDMGRAKVGESIWQRGNRSRHEQAIYAHHPEWGDEMVRGKVPLAREAREAILFHHEKMDGSGFPKGLKGEALPMAARIVGLTDRYEKLCNPPPGGRQLQPFQVLARLFKEEAAWWDPRCLKALIATLGVYPPGTLVELSNGQWGMVCSFEPGASTRPTVEVYDPDTPKNEALLVNLKEEEEVSIVRAVSPEMMPADALAYLAPRRAVVYYQMGKKS